jgi:enamine deaminase RidA (YjgF/YER057c/UK114 family)
MANRIRVGNPDTLPKPAGVYSRVARASAGELLFIAGQVAVDGAGKVVGADD